MKKNELMNGDIVVLRSGYVAVVIGEGEDAYLLYQYGGFEFLDEYYDDDLYNEIDDDKVMQIFRSNGGFGFEGVDQEVPIWERDEIWACPSEQEREDQHRVVVEQLKAEFEATMERVAEEETDRKEYWDELEKSIVANLADDVIVGINGRVVDIVIKKRF